MAFSSVHPCNKCGPVIKYIKSCSEFKACKLSCNAVCILYCIVEFDIRPNCIQKLDTFCVIFEIQHLPCHDVSSVECNLARFYILEPYIIRCMEFAESTVRNDFAMHQFLKWWWNASLLIYSKATDVLSVAGWFMDTVDLYKYITGLNVLCMIHNTLLVISRKLHNVYLSSVDSSGTNVCCALHIK